MSALVAQAKEAEFPLEHSWTLYYDSRATARAAQLAAAAKSKAAAQSTSAVHPSPSGHGSNETYEAGLSTIGTFTTVQSFCRLYNWTKRPSRMGQNENLHLFKDGIMPMWEDAKNQNGGKWVLQVDVGKREEIDRFWTWLCLALVRP
jgi:translation initiation factor 4E